MSFNTGGWEDLDYCPQIWTTIDQKRDRAPPADRTNLKALQIMAENPDEYLKFMFDQPRFKAEEVLSPTSTAGTHTTAADTDKDAEAFYILEKRVWEAELKAAAPAILLQAKAEAEAKTEAVLGEKAGKAKRDECKKTRVRALQVRLVGAFSDCGLRLWQPRG